MALQLALTKTSISSDCNTMVVTDSTGNYNITTNPGGYGAPNETRANLYLKLIVSLRKSTGRETIPVPSYNPNTATTWTITITEDGWYELYLFGCKIWSNAITYDTGYIVYDVATGKWYKSIQSGNLNNAVTLDLWWAEATEVEDFQTAIDLSQADIYATTKNITEICRTNKCEGQMLLAAQCDPCNDCTLKGYEKVRMKLEVVIYNTALGDFTEAQEIIEDLQDICSDIKCDCAGCN